MSFFMALFVVTGCNGPAYAPYAPVNQPSTDESVWMETHIVYEYLPPPGDNPSLAIPSQMTELGTFRLTLQGTEAEPVHLESLQMNWWESDPGELASAEFLVPEINGMFEDCEIQTNTFAEPVLSQADLEGLPFWERSQTHEVFNTELVLHPDLTVEISPACMRRGDAWAALLFTVELHAELLEAQTGIPVFHLSPNLNESSHARFATELFTIPPY